MEKDTSENTTSSINKTTNNDNNISKESEECNESNITEKAVMHNDSNMADGIEDDNKFGKDNNENSNIEDGYGIDNNAGNNMMDEIDDNDSNMADDDDTNMADGIYGDDHDDSNMGDCSVRDEIEDSNMVEGSVEDETEDLSKNESLILHNLNQDKLGLKSKYEDYLTDDDESDFEEDEDITRDDDDQSICSPEGTDAIESNSGQKNTSQTVGLYSGLDDIVWSSSLSGTQDSDNSDGERETQVDAFDVSSHLKGTLAFGLPKKPATAIKSQCYVNLKKLYIKSSGNSKSTTGGGMVLYCPSKRGIKKFDKSNNGDKSEKKKLPLDNIDHLSDELQIGYRILSELMSDSLKTYNGVFIESIALDKSINGEYLKVVEKPLWLPKIKEDLLKGNYKDLTELIADIRLMLENTYKYFGPAHSFSRKGLRIEFVLEQKIALLQKDLKSKCSLEATHGVTPEQYKELNRTKSSRITVNGDNYFSYLLYNVRGHRMARDKEMKLKKVELMKQAKLHKEREMIEWERTLLEGPLGGPVKHMWEIPQINQFIFLSSKVLKLNEPVSIFELERVLMIPEASVTLRMLMTSLVSSPQQRQKLAEKPYMPYNIWARKLAHKAFLWYRIYYKEKEDSCKLQDQLGIEPTFWDVCGRKNPFDKQLFHEMTLYQRVWLLKALCDYIAHNHKSVQEAIAEQPEEIQRESILGCDNNGNEYIHFPSVCLNDLRIYKRKKILYEYKDISPQEEIGEPVPQALFTKDQINSFRKYIKNMKKRTRDWDDDWEYGRSAPKKQLPKKKKREANKPFWANQVTPKSAEKRSRPERLRQTPKARYNADVVEDDLYDQDSHDEDFIAIRKELKLSISKNKESIDKLIEEKIDRRRKKKKEDDTEDKLSLTYFTEGDSASSSPVGKRTSKRGRRKAKSPIACKICGKKFSMKSAMHGHMAIHFKKKDKNSGENEELTDIPNGKFESQEVENKSECDKEDAISEAICDKGEVPIVKKEDKSVEQSDTKFNETFKQEKHETLKQENSNQSIEDEKLNKVENEEMIKNNDSDVSKEEKDVKQLKAESSCANDSSYQSNTEKVENIKEEIAEDSNINDSISASKESDNVQNGEFLNKKKHFELPVVSSDKLDNQSEDSNKRIELDRTSESLQTSECENSSTSQPIAEPKEKNSLDLIESKDNNGDIETNSEVSKNIDNLCPKISENNESSQQLNDNKTSDNEEQQDNNETAEEELKYKISGPDPDEFELVASSVAELQELICKFGSVPRKHNNAAESSTEEKKTDSEAKEEHIDEEKENDTEKEKDKQENKENIKRTRCEEKLYKALCQLLSEFGPLESKLNSALRQARRQLWAEYKDWKKRDESYVDPAEEAWLSDPEPEPAPSATPTPKPSSPSSSSSEESFNDDGTRKRKLRKRRAKKYTAPPSPPSVVPPPIDTSDQDAITVSSRGRIRKVKKMFNYDNMDFEKLAQQADQEAQEEKEKKKRRKEESEDDEEENPDLPPSGEVKRYILNDEKRVVGYVGNDGKTYSLKNRNDSYKPQFLKPNISSFTAEQAASNEKTPKLVVSALNVEGKPVFVRVFGSQALHLANLINESKGQTPRQIKLQRFSQSYTFSTDSQVLTQNIPGFPDSDVYNPALLSNQTKKVTQSPSKISSSIPSPSKISSPIASQSPIKSPVSRSFPTLLSPQSKCLVSPLISKPTNSVVAQSISSPIGALASNIPPTTSCAYLSAVTKLVTASPSVVPSAPPIVSNVTQKLAVNVQQPATNASTSSIIVQTEKGQQIKIALQSERLAQLVQKSGNRIMAIPNGKGGYTLSLVGPADKAPTTKPATVTTPSIGQKIMLSNNSSVMNSTCIQQPTPNIQTINKTQPVISQATFSANPPSSIPVSVGSPLGRQVIIQNASGAQTLLQPQQQQIMHLQQQTPQKVLQVINSGGRQQLVQVIQGAQLINVGNNLGTVSNLQQPTGIIMQQPKNSFVQQSPQVIIQQALPDASKIIQVAPQSQYIEQPHQVVIQAPQQQSVVVQQQPIQQSMLQQSAVQISSQVTPVRTVNQQINELQQSHLQTHIYQEPDSTTGYEQASYNENKPNEITQHNQQIRLVSESSIQQQLQVNQKLTQQHQTQLAQHQQVQFQQQHVQLPQQQQVQLPQQQQVQLTQQQQVQLPQQQQVQLPQQHVQLPQQVQMVQQQQMQLPQQPLQLVQQLPQNRMQVSQIEYSQLNQAQTIHSSVAGQQISQTQKVHLVQQVVQPSITQQPAKGSQVTTVRTNQQTSRVVQQGKLVLVQTNQGQKVGVQTPDGRLTLLNAEQLQPLIANGTIKLNS